MVYTRTSIRFGLINFDVELETIRKTENTLSFEGVSDCCKATTNAKKFCSICGKEQKWNSDLKGYKISKNEKVILKKEELEALDNFKNGITIVGFISKEHLKLSNLDKPYFLNTGNAKDIYYMFSDALKEKGLIAIAKAVLRGKEHLAVIYNLENSNHLIIQELLANKEIQPKETEVKYDSNMKEMMKLIIQQNTLESYDANEYKNEYVENAKKLIQDKYTTGNDIIMVEIAETTKPKDLKNALEQMKELKIVV